MTPETRAPEAPDLSTITSKPGQNANRDVILEVRGARKAFGFVTVLRGVDLTLHRGEILALLGDNGAGKSTLVKAISGIVPLDEGAIVLDGKPLRLRTSMEARALGIETVFQDLAVFDNLDVASNFLIARERPRPRWLGPLGLISRSAEEREWTDHASSLSVSNVSARQEIGLMSGGQRQAVAVARAVAFASKIVILDEPTAALGVRESREVLNLVRRLPERGISVILISHNMEHVIDVADRALVLRQGQSTGTIDVAPGIAPRLVGMIMGADLGDSPQADTTSP
jgi:ABC-type sugar transport system ATPase subunit